ncbi:hypothetical protein D3C87_536030 [compost metagenome]
MHCSPLRYIDHSKVRLEKMRIPPCLIRGQYYWNLWSRIIVFTMEINEQLIW